MPAKHFEPKQRIGVVSLVAWKCFFLCLFTLFQYSGFAQQLKVSTKNKKAAAAFYQGMEHYNAYEYLLAEQTFIKAVNHDNKFKEALQMLGTLYEETGRLEEAIKYYEKVVEIDAGFFPKNYNLIGNLSMKTGNYEKAAQNYRQFEKQRDIPVAIRQQAKENIRKAENAIQLTQNPVPFTPVNLGANINTGNAEYSPTLTADEQTLIYTVSRPRDAYTICEKCKEEEDFYISQKKNGAWSVGVPLGHPLNSRGNEGASCISPDGMFFYFTACNRDDGYGSCDLYYSLRENGRWSVPTNMGKDVNSNKWDSQPTIAPDGKTLYFTSARSGNMDIYMTVRDEEGKWCNPVRLNDTINTRGSEMAPFIHPDGRTLYFASDGHEGLGGLDIFFSRKTDSTQWSAPENIGYPINTHNDESFFIVNARGNTAYFASDKIAGYGKFDLFTFELPIQARPEPVTYLKGHIADAETKIMLKADFELIDLTSGKNIVRSVSDAIDGSFLVSIPSGRNFALHVSCSGYLFYSEHFYLEQNDDSIRTFEKNIFLQPMKQGEVVVLKNIFFDFDKDILKEESFSELNKLVDLLNKNKTMQIEIRGHTDNMGTAQYNKVLSEKRALSVYNYLITKGIDERRLRYAGFGSSLPIDSNTTEEGRANNRRTEFKVTGFY